MHPGSRLRENKESENQPTRERGGIPLGAPSADEQRVLHNTRTLVRIAGWFTCTHSPVAQRQSRRLLIVWS